MRLVGTPDGALFEGTSLQRLGQKAMKIANDWVYKGKVSKYGGKIDLEREKNFDEFC